MARTMVPICYETWHKVPKHLKENLWTAITIKFDPNPSTKKSVISDIGCLWKNFKGDLTKKYIKPFKNDPGQLKKRPEKYKKFIQQKDWDEFVKSRLSETFENLSNVQVAKRAKNKYTHYISKLGYAGFAEKMKKERGDSFDESARSFLWKAARQNKKGEYRDDVAKEVGEKINTLKSRVKDGSLVSEGSSDILTMALGTAELGGRVRGVGKGVTPTTYFHISRRGSKKHISELESRLHEEDERNKKKDKQLQELKEQLIKLQSGLISSPVEKVASNTQKSANEKYVKISSNTSGSCDSPPKKKKDKFKGKEKKENHFPQSNYKLNIGKGKPCRLFLDSNTIVAAGLVFEKVGPNDTVHHMSLGEDNVRVSIDKVYHPDANLPIPVANANMMTVKDALGSQVAWPKKHVLLDVEKDKNIDCGGKRNIVVTFANSLDKVLEEDTLRIPIGIFGDKADATYVPKDELVRFCKMEELDIVCVIAYMRCSYEKFEMSLEVFKFVNPVTAREAYKEFHMDKLVIDLLAKSENNQIFFIPLNTGHHWVLVAIDFSSMTVYWMDSLHGQPDQDVKISINIGLKALNYIGKKRQSATWQLIKGPKQPGNFECGFYMLLYMRKLMDDPFKSTDVKMKELIQKEKYEKHELDALQLEFIEFIQSYI